MIFIVFTISPLYLCTQYLNRGKWSVLVLNRQYGNETLPLPPPFQNPGYATSPIFSTINILFNVFKYTLQKRITYIKLIIISVFLCKVRFIINLKLYTFGQIFGNQSKIFKLSLEIQFYLIQRLNDSTHLQNKKSNSSIRLCASVISHSGKFGIEFWGSYSPPPQLRKQVHKSCISILYTMRIKSQYLFY